LHGRAVVVLSNNDGCVIARNTEAKQLGIGMGVPAFEVRHLLQAHNVHIFSSNYTLYADMSRRVMNVLTQFAPEIEVYSIDECFMLMSGVAPQELEAFAHRVRETVLQWVKIPVSIGIAPTKTLAKAANRIAKKKEGIWIINTEQERIACLQELPLADVWGIGRRYLDRLLDRGLQTGYDLSLQNQGWMRQNLTIVGERMLLELQGTPCLAMQPQREQNDTVCTSRSFGRLITDEALILNAVATHAHRCGEKLRTQQRAAQYIQVFLITNRHRKDLPQYNPSATLRLPVPTSNTPELVHYATLLLRQMYRPGYQYMKTGVIVSGLLPNNALQGHMFDTLPRPAHDKASAVMDKLNARYGRDVVRTAQQGYSTGWQLRSELRSPSYTTHWAEVPRVKMG